MSTELLADFVETFGILSPGPKNPSNPADKSVALYDANTLARRYVFDDQYRAIDTRTGEVAFRVDGAGRFYLPNGKEIAAPRAVPRPPANDPAAKLYGSNRSTAPAAVRHPALSDEQRFAKALYGKTQ